MMLLNMPFIREISYVFNRSAAGYEKSAIAASEIGQRLFERLDYLTIEPNYILDLGCGPGDFSKKLKKRYPKATICSLDLSERMLVAVKNKQSWRKRWPLVCADMHHLPFVDGLFDLVFANQVLHWSHPLPVVIAELNRVMNREGCLMFSTLGPDTFQELACAGENPVMINAQLLDMHDIGDCLIHAKFLDPVMDMEMLVVHHPHLIDLLKSMRIEGVRSAQKPTHNGLIGKQHWFDFLKNMQKTCTDSGKFPLTHEVLYGHAWKGSQRKIESGIETYIPITALRRGSV
jgi:malonyl-CoA O-methyltransferase